MPYILTSGIQEADYSAKQSTVQDMIDDLFPLKPHEKKRLLPIFENAHISERQFSQPLDWFRTSHGLKERNEIYQDKALRYSIGAVEKCLSNKELLKDKVIPSEIDHILFVSSTGIATPTLDTYIMNEMGMRENVKRTPLFGLGCAGGTSGVGKAYEWLLGNPEGNVLVICVELCSLTFQRKDPRVSNFVGTALFGDGASAVLLTGDASTLNEKRRGSVPKITGFDSKTKKHSTDVMGWRIVDTGFEVIFNKSIPKLVRDFWSGHAKEVLDRNGWRVEELPFLIAHPGGRKVLESYQEIFGLDPSVLRHSSEVLARHGNMSSPTVHFVLDRVLQDRPHKGVKSLMASLGPGFSSEIVSLEWV
ncbi:UNVERIFIED_CONTAM: naringenin-chalcone synthase [Halobacillus marinus]